MKAIVYESNAGHTRKYAEILGGKLGLPVYSVKEAKSALSEKDEILFMGWLMAGNVAGFSKVQKQYSVLALCGVGMAQMNFSGKFAKEMAEKYGFSLERVFYLQGGYDSKKLRGMYKFMMSAMTKSISKKLESQPDKTAEEIEMLEIAKYGKDCVSEENLAPVLAWCQTL